MNAQALSNTAWAFAKAGNAPPALFDALAKRAVVRLHRFNPQNLANTAWAYATVGMTPELQLFEQIERVALRKLVDLNTQNLANICWVGPCTQPQALRPVSVDVSRPSAAQAYAALGLSAPELFSAVAAAAPPKLAGFKPQVIPLAHPYPRPRLSPRPRLPRS